MMSRRVDGREGQRCSLKAAHLASTFVFAFAIHCATCKLIEVRKDSPGSVVESRNLWLNMNAKWIWNCVNVIIIKLR